MKTTPRTGMTGEERLTVDSSNRIVFADDRMPAVLATPWLVAHLEYAARNAIAPCLADNERSVGSFMPGRCQRGTQESNLALRFWRPPCYRYTSPPSPRGL